MSVSLQRKKWGDTVEDKKYQHEVIVPSKGLPFKLFMFEGGAGNYVREKHWHQSIEIFAVQQGELVFSLNEDKFPLAAGNFVIVNSNEVHSIRAKEANETIVLQIPLNEFKEYFTEEGLLWFSHNEKEYDGKVQRLIAQMYAMYQEKDVAYEYQVLSRFYEILALLVKKYRKTELEDELLRTNKQLKRLGMITSYMKEHYKDDLSLEMMAKQFGYSTSYLSRMFRRYAKVNYKDYLQSIRLEHAVKDLENSEIQIVDIALEHGFPNSKAFSNLFRKRYGILPNEYRKKST